MLKNRTSIGVDIGVRTLRAVALSHEGNAFRLRAMVETVRTPNHPVPTRHDVERLLHALERQGIDARRISLAVPPDRLASAIVELPPRSSGAPIETLAQAELTKGAPGGLEVFIWDLPPGRRARASEYFAIGLQHEAANELLLPFTQCGLDVDHLEPEATALQRITGQNNRVVFMAGARNIGIYAFDTSSTLFMRTIELAGESVESDRVHTSLVGTIDYLAERFPMLEEASVIVLGEPKASDRLSASLLLEYETTVVRELRVDIRSTGWLADFDLDTRWATAIGLAAGQSSLEVAA